jgi:hypothetical protein
MGRQRQNPSKSNRWKCDTISHFSLPDARELLPEAVVHRRIEHNSLFLSRCAQNTLLISRSPHIESQDRRAIEPKAWSRAPE